MSPAKPAWLSILEQQLKENTKCLAYAFSTLSQEGTPKVRHVIHRGCEPHIMGIIPIIHPGCSYSV